MARESRLPLEVVVGPRAQESAKEFVDCKPFIDLALDQIDKIELSRNRPAV
jgi:hypothetical protein